MTNYARVIFLFAAMLIACCSHVVGLAQEVGNSTPDAGVSPAELQRLAAEAASNRSNPPAPIPAELRGSNINILVLLRQGGGIMAVIAVISLLVVAVAFERLFALRSGKLFPRGLRREVRRACEEVGPFQPHTLFEAADRYHCAGSRIIHEMLRKVGRPIPEVEAVLAEGSQREADRLYGNVRWLTLAAAVTPLIGLLGTVWGMIIAFHDTTQLGAGSNKAEYLAEGIYVALVTTLGGLAVAIPAAIIAHFFEGRITKMLALIDTELRRLMPRFESQEDELVLTSTNAVCSVATRPPYRLPPIPSDAPSFRPISHRPLRYGTSRRGVTRWQSH
ncbi:MAG: MotA/TolQ/ExbB proton channel family protein [Pirellulaceae bacterium]